MAKAAAPAAEFTDKLRGRRPTFTRIAMKELASNPVISFEKAAKELGYAPRRYTKRFGIRSNGFVPTATCLKNTAVLAERTKKMKILCI
jgi:hypothetical protein